MSDVVNRLLQGAVDTHVHPHPSPFPRRIDIVEAADLAAEAGMRAIVVKSHHHSTATDVLALKGHGLEGKIEVLPAVALNSQVGGLNPAAVNMCLAMGGRVVWLPTISSPAHLAQDHAIRFPSLAIPLTPEEPIDVWTERGTLKPEVLEIVRMVAEADAVLASGHLPPVSILAVFEAAKEAGVRRLLLNHPNFVINATVDEVRRIVDLGAVVEHSLCMYHEESTFYNWALDILVQWVRDVGPENSMLGSDLGQEANPLPTDAFHLICERLLAAGLTEREVRMIVADNGAALLGIDG